MRQSVEPRLSALLGAGLALITLIAPAAAEQLELTEAELRPFDGSDPDKPIYLAVDGTIFDVSASPAFYGPGGHYNHFTGRDATRAWVTECWDTADQLTWRMDGVEEMFLPKYMDELMEAAATGDDVALGPDIGKLGKETVEKMAAKALERFGKIDAEERRLRREEGLVEAQAKVKETLDHWYRFFADNPKYSAVGKVILDESTPDPPKPCEAAMKKRPIKAGKLDSMAASVGNIMGAGSSKQKGSENMPDFVNKLKDRKQEPVAEENAAAAEDDDEDLVRDEL